MPRVDEDWYEDDSPIHGFGFVVQPLARFFGFMPRAPDTIEIDGHQYVRTDLIEYEEDGADEAEGICD